MREIERKYHWPDSAALPDLGEVKGVASVVAEPETTLHATYFDTPDHRLLHAGITVRRRTGGGDEGWHLKIQAPDGEGRHELHLGLGRAVHRVPKRYRDLLQGIVGEQPLGPVAEIVTRRRVHLLLDTDGGALAEVAEDDVAGTVLERAENEDTAGGSAQTWREVEVERREGGSRGLLRRAGDLIEAAGGDPGVPQSKLAYVLGAEPSPPTGPPRPSRGKDRVAVLVQHRLAEQTHALVALDPAVRAGLPEAVHKMRVAVRRLRSLLATARPFLDRGVTEPLREELAWLGRVLGGARDAEVLRARLDAAIDALLETGHHDVVERRATRSRRELQRALTGRQQEAAAEVAAALEGERYAVLLDRLRALGTRAPFSADAERRIDPSYEKRVRREGKRLARRIDRIDEMADGTDPSRCDEGLHEARKAVKRLRYAAEPLRPVLGRDAKRLVKRAKKVQSLLGRHQDAVVLRGYLAEQITDADSDLSPRAAALAGALIEREARAGADAVAHAEHRWGRLRR